MSTAKEVKMRSQQQVIFLVIALLAVSVIFITYTSVKNQNEALVKELSIKGQILSNRIAAQSLIELLFEDKDKLLEISRKAAIEDIDVVGCAFYREDGSLIVSPDSTFYWDDFFEENQKVYPEDDAIMVVTKIYDQQESVMGFLVLRMTQKRVQEISSSLINRLVLFNVIIFVVISFIIYLLFTIIRKQDEVRIDQLIKTESALTFADSLKAKNKELEEAQKKSEILASFPEEDPNPIIRVKKNGYILYYNSGGNKILHEWNVDVGGTLPEDVMEHINMAFFNNKALFADIQVSEKLYSFCFSPSEKYKAVNIFAMDVTERQRAQERVEAANRAKDMFLSTMSHEMRTPMNAVIGMTQFLLQNKPMPEQVQKLEVLRSSADHLMTLINDVLDYSKIEAGKIDIESIEFNLEKLIISIEHTFQYKLNERKLQLDNKIHAEVPRVIKGDPVRLNQILNNLIGNAIKFTHEGNISLEILVQGETEEFIDILFHVKDTGIGIDASKIELIFENFSQENASTTRKYGGTGLGLAISKKLVELQGGKVNVRSQKGIGSVFTFNILYRKADSQEEIIEEEEMDTKRDLKGAKVLVVDDNEFNILVAVQFISEWNTQIDTATSGNEAIDMIKAKNYDVVLMDLQMPEMDGYEATSILKALDGDYYKKLPIIALTADAFNDVKQKVLDVGMIDHVTKPVNPDDLYFKIRKNLL